MLKDCFGERRGGPGSSNWSATMLSPFPVLSHWEVGDFQLVLVVVPVITNRKNKTAQFPKVVHCSLGRKTELQMRFIRTTEILPPDVLFYTWNPQPWVSNSSFLAHLFLVIFRHSRIESENINGHKKKPLAECMNSECLIKKLIWKKWEHMH